MSIVATAVALAIVAGGAVIAYSLLVLPAPAGPFPVGTLALTLDRPIEPGETSPGRFTVQIWYPALPSTDRAPYGTGVGGVKAWVYHHLVRTHSARGAALAPRRSPLVIYVAGWGGQRTDNTTLAEELASHGYIVAGLDDVTHDSPVLDRLAGAADVRSAEAYHATLALARRRLAYESLRVSAVLDYLTKLDGGAGRFTGRIDLRHVAIVGYSFGGAVALETCHRDKRFLAAMNLDGLLFGAGNGDTRRVPYFLVSDTMPAPTARELTSSDPAVRYMSELIVSDAPDQSKALRHGGYELQVAGAEHVSFTDAPLYAPWQRFRAGWSNPPRIAAALSDYTLAFLGRALNGTRSPLLTPGTRGSPAMSLAIGEPGTPQ
jgi:dienelactone hydrolase